MMLPEVVAAMLAANLDGAETLDTGVPNMYALRVGTVEVRVDTDLEYPDHFYWSIHTAEGGMQHHAHTVCWNEDDAQRVLAEVKAKVDSRWR